MNGRYGTLTGMVLSCGLLLCGTDADAGCKGTGDKRILNLDTHKIEMVQKDSRCVRTGVNDDSGTFHIQVNFAPGYSVNLSDIEVTAKDTASPVRFQATPISNKTVLSVRVTWTSEPDPNAEYGYNVTVPGLGKLDPKVQIIRQPFASFYSSALAQLAEEYLDEEAYESIIKEGLLPKLPATTD